MANKINTVPEKKPETETPTIIENSADPQAAEHKKMERMADRAAQKGRKDQERYDQEHTTFSN